MVTLWPQRSPDLSKLPHFAFGHSLGSVLTQSHIQNWGGMLDGVILCGTFGAFPA
jgi:hypothetical protein